MKNLKMNLFALIAVAIAAVTMSFNLIESREPVTYWFSVDEHGNIGGPLTETCRGGDEYCAIGFIDQPEAPVDNVDDGMDDPSFAGLEYKD